MSAPSHQQECHFCGDAGSDVELHHVKSLNDHVCFDCVHENIVPQFDKALHDEAEYTVLRGLNILDFRRFFTPAFVQRFLRREKEYNIMAGVHCRHVMLSSNSPEVGASAPKVIALDREAQAYAAANGEQMDLCGAVVCEQKEASEKVTCHRCLGDLCGRCGLDYHGPSISHECEIEKMDSASLESKLGQKVGKDLQICPNRLCNRIWALKSGCNHMTCTKCHTDFCFLCGQEVQADSGHWSRENDHPRFGQPGDSRAVFDEDLEAVEELTDGELVSDADFADESDWEELDGGDESSDNGDDWGPDVGFDDRSLPELRPNHAFGEGQDGRSMPTLRHMHDILREEGGGPDDEEAERDTDTETNEAAEDRPRFSITIAIGALLQELARNAIIIPPFLPVLLNHPSSQRRVVVGFRANPEVYTMTDVVVADIEPLNSQEANIIQADNQMWAFFFAENNAMLGIVLEDVLRRHEDGVVESEAESEDAASESEEAQDDNAVVATSTPEAVEDPLASFRALERELDEVSDSEDEDEYTDEEWEDDRSPGQWRFY